MNSAGPEEAELLLENLIEVQGEQAIYLELKGRLLFARNKLDEALHLLVRAVASHVASGSSSRYFAALCLARVLDAVYQRDRSRGDAEVSLTLDDGSVLRNTFFSVDSPAAAIDDSLQDRSLFALLEVMGDQPYFAGGLVYMLDSLNIGGDHASRMILDALAQIDSQHPKLAERHESRQRARTNTGVAAEESSDPSAPLEMKEGPTVPPHIADDLKRHEDAYDPEVRPIRSSRSRITAAITDIRRGRDDAAEKSFGEALALGPDEPESYVAMATFLSARSRHDEAVAVLRTGIENVPGAPILRLILARTLIGAGRLGEAKNSLIRTRPLVPDWRHEVEYLLTEVEERRGGHGPAV